MLVIYSHTNEAQANVFTYGNNKCKRVDCLQE